MAAVPISHTDPRSVVVAVYRKTFHERAVPVHLFIIQCFEQISGKTKSLVDGIKRKTKPFHVTIFVSSDTMRVDEKRDGGKISLDLRLVSDFLFWTEPRTIMSSDSEDDPDYVPTAPQNDGQIHIFPVFHSANERLHRRLGLIWFRP